MDNSDAKLQPPQYCGAWNLALDFSSVFPYKCWWSKLLQDDLSTGRLAGELLQDDLSTGQSSRGISV